MFQHNKLLPILLFFASQSLQAQVVPPRDSLVRSMFGPQDTVQWVKGFEGRLDDVFALDITLGYDGKNCRGLLQYRQSKLDIKLDGTLMGPVLRLQEKDENGQASAYINGTLNEGRLSADWINYINSIGGRLEMKEMKPGTEKTDFCGNNKWVNRYTGTWKGKPAEMVLERLHDGALLGQFWNGADNQSEEIKGHIEANGNYTLESIPKPGKPLLWLDGTMQNAYSTKTNWSSSNGEMSSIDFTLKESNTLGCTEYADFLSSYDILYPSTSCPACNTWMEQQIKGWVNRTKSAIQGKRLTILPANRNVLRASVWPEISCWTDRIFSGYFNYTDTWSGPAQAQHFNLDLQTGKPITFDDLFQKSFDAKTWFKEYARKESPKNPKFANDTGFREWIYNAGYPLFTLRRDGIKISTLFHPIYGQQHLTIPYSELIPYLLEDSPVAEYVK